MSTLQCPYCAETLAGPARVCPHCKSILSAAAPPPQAYAQAYAPPVKKSGLPAWAWILIVLGCVCGGGGILAIIAAIAIPSLISSQRLSNERNASGNLKTIATAQSDFRASDRDQNYTPDYWTGDIAGLYAIENCKLIEVSVALADQNATHGTLKNGRYAQPISTYGVRSAKAGYWYRALIEDQGIVGKYGQDSDASGDLVHNVSRFGACAMPESYGSSGSKVFLINEENTIYARDFGTDVLTSGAIPPGLSGAFDANWPPDSELSSNWSRPESRSR